jgi:hypothetical protein
MVVHWVFKAEDAGLEVSCFLGGAWRCAGRIIALFQPIGSILVTKKILAWMYQQAIINDSGR